MAVRCIIAASRLWYQDSADRLSSRTGGIFKYLHQPEQLTEELLQGFAPDYIFFPHWSWIIPASVLKKYRCVIFHMTDLPYGRGGSPLQNLIIRGHTETMISAIDGVNELDAGPVYLKRPLSLLGNAEEIFLRAVPIIEDMILEIASVSIQPAPQSGPVTIFKRRNPDQGDLSGLSSLEKIYDHIRMLDAAGYPSAFVEIGRMRLEFSRASLRFGRIEANVVITINEDE
ncbi:hypothetical protein LJB86_01765 [Deltaproteobacteria bacterium OttesenSCG-928-M10]|nr:hypothetical protein [Deltaproteobacteria bacterium OttesenSCG-928-M10]